MITTTQDLAQQLIRYASITPDDPGILSYLEKMLTDLGFTCHLLEFSEPGYALVRNLYARYGTESPHFCFAGHTDVVAPGPLEAWRHPPFEGTIQDGHLVGRGAVDMKGAIAAFIVATKQFLEEHKGQIPGSLSLLITGDEEGIAINGTRKVLDWLRQRQEPIDFCLVGEPSSQQALGDTIKIGRRGSLNTVLTVTGVQGHVAFPDRARNPIHALIDILAELKRNPPEPPSPHFAPSHLEITSIDVGNTTVNVIPHAATARFNIRFSDQQTGTRLQDWIRQTAQIPGYESTFAFQLSGEADVCPPVPMLEKMMATISDHTGRTPILSTDGGTSDARFIRHDCPAVFEFGLVGQTMHQIDERVSLKDLDQLTEIYGGILTNFFF